MRPATLVGLNKLWNLKLSIKDLEKLSCSIGSDIPFCISGGTKLCFGKGEIIEPTVLSNSSLAIILVKDPSIIVSTPWAYSFYKEINYSKYLSSEEEFEVKRNELRTSNWLNSNEYRSIPPLYNDLEKVVAPLTPSVENALSLLKSIPESLSVAMSGSGPSCFAIFEDIESAELVLEKYLQEFKQLGLSAWCCSFVNRGVNCKNE